MGIFNYFLTFNDNFTRKPWVYFLKHKYDAFGCFSVVQGTCGEEKWIQHQNLKDEQRG